MSTTDETTAEGEGAKPPSRKPPGWQKSAKRYGPIVLVVVLIAAAVAIFGGGGGDDDDEASTDSGGSSVDELDRVGPDDLAEGRAHRRGRRLGPHL